METGLKTEWRVLSNWKVRLKEWTNGYLQRMMGEEKSTNPIDGLYSFLMQIYSCRYALPSKENPRWEASLKNVVTGLLQQRAFEFKASRIVNRDVHVQELDIQATLSLTTAIKCAYKRYRPSWQLT